MQGILQIKDNSPIALFSKILEKSYISLGQTNLVSLALYLNFFWKIEKQFGVLIVLLDWLGFCGQKRRVVNEETVD
jgi:hypothetical protein